MPSDLSAGNNDYQLNEDIADDAINWLHEHMRFSPDKPFFVIRSLTQSTVTSQTSEEFVYHDVKRSSLVVPIS